MIKINCLSMEVFEELVRTFKGVSPIKQMETMDISNNADVYLSNKVRLSYEGDEVKILFKGRIFRMRNIDFLSIEIM